MPYANMPTLTIDNFKGSMTPYINGSLNSGLAYLQDVFGYDPFTRPGVLHWEESHTQIDAAGSVITDLIVAGKSRMESGIVYVYAIGHTGRLYKIQVNDPTTYNPNFDSPTLLATLSAQSPTFTKGGFIDFFGSTERIYIGHDKGVTRIDFAGTNETFVGVLGSWSQTVPRPLIQFLGKLYIGNGTNIAEIDSTATVITYSKLSPGYPIGSEVRDLDIVPDGTYLQAVVTKLALADITSTTPDTTILVPSESYVFKWNGTDTGYTSYVTYPAVALSANCIFGENNYVFGYDFLGGGIYNPVKKILTSTPLSAFGESPNPNGVISMSNIVSWATPLPYNGFLEAIIVVFGTISAFEQEVGYWDIFDMQATSPETDILRIPCQILVSNFAQGASSNGYTNNKTGTQKIYFSTLETSAAPTTKYRFYKWSPLPTDTGTAMDGAIYQTQNQLFSKKINVKEVRVYGDPWVANNSFTIDLIGSADTIISGGSQTFTAGTNLTVGNDYAWYNPTTKPIFALGLRVTNAGTANFTIHKIEIDYESAGK